MSKKCISCGAELAEDAAFCPYCETAQEEKRPAGMPRVRRKKGLRWAAAILAAAAVVTGGILWRSAGRTAQTEPDPETKQPGADTEANAVSVGQTTPWEGGAEVVYTDEAGQSYDLFLCFDTPRITERLPQEESVFAYNEGDPINKPSQLAVYDPETDEDLSERFFALVESCSAEAIPAEDGRKMELTEPEKNPNFQLAARMSFIQAKGGDGANEICWTIRMKNGDELDLLTGLGNGYNTRTSGDSPLLIGGGVGVPPMYMLCKKLVAEGKKVTVVLGFNSKDDVFCEDEFKALGADVHISTADGTYGTKGFVTDVIKNLQYTFFYTCGPEPMFRAMHKMMKTPGQYSFEERMGCGFGACMGCSCKTLTGNKRICKEGPVMESEEIIWAD